MPSAQVSPRFPFEPRGLFACQPGRAGRQRANREFASCRVVPTVACRTISCYQNYRNIVHSGLTLLFAGPVAPEETWAEMKDTSGKSKGSMMSIMVYGLVGVVALGVIVYACVCTPVHFPSPGGISTTILSPQARKRF